MFHHSEWALKHFSPSGCESCPGKQLRGRVLNRSVSSTVNIILSLYIYIDLNTLSLMGEA